MSQWFDLIAVAAVAADDATSVANAAVIAIQVESLIPCCHNSETDYYYFINIRFLSTFSHHTILPGTGTW